MNHSKEQLFRQPAGLKLILMPETGFLNYNGTTPVPGFNGGVINNSTCVDGTVRAFES